MITRICLALISVFGSVLPAHARVIDNWSFDKLVARSDIVVIIQATKTKKTEDLFPNYSYGHSLSDFVAFETIFNVKASLKGDLIKDTMLTFLHFVYSAKVERPIMNGAGFISFLHGPFEIQKHIFKEAKEIGTIRYSQTEPNYLAFLKRRDDGRYEPISGHYDASESFQEITPASLSWMGENETK